LRALKKEGLTLQEVKKNLKEQLTIARLIARDVKSKVKVEDSEIEEICKKQEGKPLRDVYYIYTKSSSSAEKALELLKNGVPFEKVAKEISQDRETARKGGHLGKVSPGMLIKPLDLAVWSLKPGSYKLVRVKDGFYVVYVKSEIRGHCNKRKIREQLYMMKFQKALNDYLDKLKREASVKVYM
jgi:peptidyl-prolyl cis-trans isomerase SurA